MILGYMDGCADEKLHHFLDVGANAGFFSNLAASRGFKSLSFEPQTILAHSLKQSAKLNGWSDRISVFNNAVSDKLETVELFSEGLGAFVASKGAAGMEPTDKRAEIMADTRKQLIKTIILDQIVPQHLPSGHSVCIMKVDVEGHEANVFASARELFKQHRIQRVLFEYVPNFMGKTKAIEGLRILSDAGYKLSFYGGEVVPPSDIVKAVEKMMTCPPEHYPCGVPTFLAYLPELNY